MSHSTIGATALASPRPHPRPSTSPRRHLEVAPTRAQRRARPKLVHAVVLLTGVVAVLLAQLGLSMAVADGAYQISSLQVEQRDLLRDSEALAENLESLQSPQFLASNAEALGMVASGSLPYIDVSTGAVSGRERPRPQRWGDRQRDPRRRPARHRIPDHPDRDLVVELAGERRPHRRRIEWRRRGRVDRADGRGGVILDLRHPAVAEDPVTAEPGSRETEAGGRS